MRVHPGQASHPYVAVARFTTDSFAPSPVVLESDEQDIGLIMRPAFDHLWQALGRQRCTPYDERGHWVDPTAQQIE